MDIIKEQRHINQRLFALDRDLRSTNKNLNLLRTTMKSESNVKARKIYLDKYGAMMREQHRLQLLKAECRKRLNALAKSSGDEQLLEENGRGDSRSKLMQLLEQEPARKAETLTPDIVDLTDTPKHEFLNGLNLQQYKKCPRCEELNELSPPNGGKRRTCSTCYRYKKQQNRTCDKSTNTDKEVLPVQTMVPLDRISINNQNDVLEHIKALQEYAMMNENFRAIELLTQVERVFIHPPDQTDFEL